MSEKYIDFLERRIQKYKDLLESASAERIVNFLLLDDFEKPLVVEDRKKVSVSDMEFMFEYSEDIDTIKEWIIKAGGISKAIPKQNLAHKEYVNKYCDECKTKRECSRRCMCINEHDALCAWSPDGYDPFYEINRQLEKDD